MKQIKEVKINIKMEMRLPIAAQKFLPLLQHSGFDPASISSFFLSWVVELLSLLSKAPKLLNLYV